MHAPLHIVKAPRTRQQPSFLTVLSVDVSRRVCCVMLQVKVKVIISRKVIQRIVEIEINFLGRVIELTSQGHTLK